MTAITSRKLLAKLSREGKDRSLKVLTKLYYKDGKETSLKVLIRLSKDRKYRKSKPPRIIIKDWQRSSLKVLTTL